LKSWIYFNGATDGSPRMRMLIQGARLHLFDVGIRGTIRPRSFPEAKSAALKALEIEEHHCACARTSRDGGTFLRLRISPKRRSNCKAPSASSRTSPHLHWSFGLLVLATGRWEVRFVRWAGFQLDLSAPISVGLANGYYAHDYERAHFRRCRAAIDVNPHP